MIVLAQESPNLFSFVKDFMCLAATSALDDKTLRTLFWIGATIHLHIDLPDTTGLDWKETVIGCLESVAPRSRTQPDPEPVSPSTAEYSCVPPADGELPPAVSRQPEQEKRTELTLALEVEPHGKSDQGCEPKTTADEGVMNKENEDQLTVYYSPSFRQDPYHLHSPPAQQLPDVNSHTSSMWKPCYDVEPQVLLPPAASVREDPTAPPPAFDLFAPSRPVGSILAPPTFSSTGDPQTCDSTGLPHPAGPPLVSHHTTSVTDLWSFHCTLSLHPYNCSGFLLALGVTSVLHHTGSTSFDGRRCDIAEISRASDAAGVHWLCACGSIDHASVGHSPAVACLVITWTPPSFVSTMGCQHWGALGLCHRPSTNLRRQGIVVPSSPSLCLTIRSSPHLYPVVLPSPSLRLILPPSLLFCLPASFRHLLVPICLSSFSYLS
ncbi:unnamed protein product [Leuciscus chuanchicus]